MNYPNDKISRVPTVQLEEKDLGDANEIEAMMSGAFICHKCGTPQLNSGWKKLSNYFESMRLILLEKIKKSVDSVTTENNTKIQTAKLIGFDHFLNIPKIIQAQAEEIRDGLKEKNDEPQGNQYGD